MGTEVQMMSDEFELEVDDGVDLYDDMITSSARRDSESQDGPSTSPAPVANNVSASGMNNGKPPSSTDSHGSRESSSIQPLRKFQVYVGNLTWWTSDQDMQDAAKDIGVTDFIEVKFYENRANGQSKGYCVVTVGSENSLKMLHEKLPKKELHGQSPVVTPPTKQALNQFEAQAKTRPSGTSNDKGPSGGDMNMMNMGMGGPPMGMGPRGMMGPGPRGQRGMGPPPPGMGPPPHRNMGPNMGSPSGYGGPPRPMMPPNMGPMQGPPRGMPMMNDPFYPQGPPMGPRGPNPGSPMGPRDNWPRSPMNHFPHGPGPHGPPHGQHMNSPGGPPMQGPMRGPMPPQMQGPPPQQAPAPHMNPAFFHQQQQGPSPAGPPMQGPGPMGPGPGPYNANSGPGPYPGPPMDHRGSPSAPPNISDVEFEEVMSRNRTVSSSAISRAVSDAATGEFASAIETLVTAISLIRQSKVANDDRCKILVSSLNDTLHGIEAKGYGGLPRSRERSRSRERNRHRDRRRERSRSREYRDRSRERDRYYDYPRERSRSREYRDRPPRDEGARPYYDERYRERERPVPEREREPRSSRTEQERSREREPEREREREVVSHRTARH